MIVVEVRCKRQLYNVGNRQFKIVGFLHLDLEIITQEEFDKKKKELLNL